MRQVSNSPNEIPNGNLEKLPEVSVVIAAKNEARYLRDALESVLSQTGVSFELVFVDDNSDDHSLEIASTLTQNYSNLRIYKNPSRGKCSAFNLGVSFARGRFTCIFAGDDIMPAGSLAARYAAVKDELDSKPVVGLSKLVTMSEMPKFDGHLVPKAPGRGALSGVSPLMNKLVLNTIFPVPEDLPNEDTWMELAVLHMPDWTIIHSDVICCKWRVHSGNSLNMTLPFKDYNQRMTIRFSAYSMYFERFQGEMTPSQRQILAGKVACEQKRKAGDWLGVLLAPVPLIDRLRALSLTNSFMYEIRRRLYGLLTGW